MSQDFTYENLSGPNYRKLPNAIAYLRSIDLNNLINDQKAFEAMYLWSRTIGFFSSDMVNYLKQDNNSEIMSSLMGDILNELTQLIDEIDFDDIYVEHDDQFKKLSKNHRLISLITYSLYTVNLSLAQSVTFNIHFTAHNGLKSLLRFLNQEVLTKTMRTSITDFSKTNLNLVNYVVLDLNSMSKFSEENADLWRELNVLDILLNVGKQKSDCQFDAYVTISYIATDKQIESLNEIHNVVSALANLASVCANDFRKGAFNRGLRPIIDDDKKPQSVDLQKVKRSDGIETTILTPLSSLYRLAVSSKLRSDIYFGRNTKDDLKVILQKGNEPEKRLALKLIGQLSFDKSVSDDIQQDSEYMNILNSLNNDGSFSRLVDGIKWNLKTNDSVESRDQGDNKASDKHIMISYNSASRGLCLKVKSFLESIGHKVWIDVSNIHGASLDSMARAVENSYCVLICVTEKYRQSLNCQAEAQYAFKLNKHIIPLIMEKGYENCNGWLGIIMSDKIFINFMKYDYDECLRRLKSEIDNYMNIARSTGTGSAFVEDTGERKNARSWNEVQVQEWFEENNIDTRVVNQFVPCTGAVLKQLYDLRNDAPEFYFQSLNTKKEAELKNVLEFTELLKKLFN